MIKGIKASFRKKNGDIRTMIFVKLENLPGHILAEQVRGTGGTKKLQEGSELVYDVEKKGFRVFNWRTVIGPPIEVEVTI